MGSKPRYRLVGFGTHRSTGISLRRCIASKSVGSRRKLPKSLVDTSSSSMQTSLWCRHLMLGMRWDWSISQNAVDWWDASSTLVDTVLVHHVDPSLGPVLQIGCGESPLPQMLHRAGFLDSEHLDISPQVIMSMRDRYSGPEWQGMKFHVRDFMRESTGGPPLLAHRFAAVIDKAGIWDWLQDEAPWALPRLLANVLAALVKPPQVGVYVVVTKQTPREFQRSLALAPIVFVESSRSLNELAWAYVLVPH